ncbi:MAG: hypothetical protein WC867_00725 [Candidatus Pacearchaeota archaeon]|jgi:hypothetical protein
MKRKKESNEEEIVELNFKDKTVDDKMQKVLDELQKAFDSVEKE